MEKKMEFFENNKISMKSDASYGVSLDEKASSLTQGYRGLSMTEQANAHYYFR